MVQRFIDFKCLNGISYGLLMNGIVLENYCKSTDVAI